MSHIFQLFFERGNSLIGNAPVITLNCLENIKDAYQLTKIRLADLAMVRHASSCGSSYSGKSNLSESEKQALSDAGQSGTLNATLKGLRNVEKIKMWKR